MNDRYKWIPNWEQPQKRHIGKSVNQLERFRKPKTIFVGSMCDLFGDWVAEDFIHNILTYCEDYPQHTFIFLTKNPKRYREFKFPDNCWLGTTVTNSHDLYCNYYFVNKKLHFISFEPLLENIDNPILKPKHISWIIIGTLNRNGKPVKPENGGTQWEWIDNIIKQAIKKDIPIFLKDSVYKAFPDEIRIYDYDIPIAHLYRQLPYLK
jgi:protein gp37